MPNYRGGWLGLGFRVTCVAGGLQLDSPRLGVGADPERAGGWWRVGAEQGEVALGGIVPANVEHLDGPLDGPQRVEDLPFGGYLGVNACDAVLRVGECSCGATQLEGHGVGDGRVGWHPQGEPVPTIVSRAPMYPQGHEPLGVSIRVRKGGQWVIVEDKIEVGDAIVGFGCSFGQRSIKGDPVLARSGQDGHGIAGLDAEGGTDGALARLRPVTIQPLAGLSELDVFKERCPDEIYCLMQFCVKRLLLRVCLGFEMAFLGRLLGSGLATRAAFRFGSSPLGRGTHQRKLVCKEVGHVRIDSRGFVFPDGDAQPGDLGFRVKLDRH